MYLISVTPYLTALRASTWNNLGSLTHPVMVLSGGNFHSSTDEKEAFYLHQSQTHMGSVGGSRVQVAVIVSCEIWPSVLSNRLRIEDISSEILG